jgi:hypothetical protein
MEYPPIGRIRGGGRRREGVREEDEFADGIYGVLAEKSINDSLGWREIRKIC